MGRYGLVSLVLIVSILFLSPLAFAQIWTPNLDEGLVNYWNMSSSKSVKGGNDLIAVGSPTFQSSNCKIGDCGLIDSTTEYWFVDDSVNNDQLRPEENRGWSLNFWTRSVSDLSNQLLFSKGDGGNFWFVQYGGDPDNKFSFESNVASTNQVNMPQIIKFDYYMVTFTQNSTSFCSWLDSVLYDCVNITGPYDPNPNILTFGREGGCCFSFLGQLDEIGIWNRSLTSAEVDQLYNSGDGITFELFICGNGVVEGIEQCDDGKHCEDFSICTEDPECTGIGDDLCLPRSGDSCTLDCRIDTDMDTVADEDDNCPLVFNPGQEDSDGNGFGDACDGVTDLVIESEGIIFSDDLPIKNQVITITAIFHNILDVNPMLIEVKFYDGHPDNGTFIGSDIIDTTGESASDAYFAQTEWQAVEGSHDIFVFLDPLDLIHEANETNNIAFRTIIVNAIDLLVTESDLGFTNPEPTEGEEINILAMIHNPEIDGANNFSVLFYLDIPSNVIALESMSLGPESTDLLIIPWIAVAGDHNITVSIDPENNIEEVNETNNMASISIFVEESNWCLGDINNDGVVGTADLLILLVEWGPNPGHPADLDGDGIVGTADLLALLANWGPCGAQEASAPSDKEWDQIESALDDRFGNDVPVEIDRAINQELSRDISFSIKSDNLNNNLEPIIRKSGGQRCY